MRRFRFSLERVLQVAALRERLATQEFAAAMRRLAEERAGLNAAEARRRRAQDELDRQTRGVIETTAALFTAGYIRALTVEIDDRRVRAAEAARAAEEKRQALLAQMKARKALERLRERRLAEYQAEVLREEQRDIDEMAQQIRARQQ